MQQVAVRWQSKTFCRNLACRVGTTLGLHSPPATCESRQSEPLSRKYISIQEEQDPNIKTLKIPLHKL